MIKVEKGVPIPKGRPGPKPGKNPLLIYPWYELEIGDSFFGTARNLPCMISRVGERLGRKFTSRRVVEDGLKGFRIWRIR